MKMSELKAQSIHEQLTNLSRFNVNGEEYIIEDGRVYRTSDDHFAFIYSPGYGGNWGYTYEDKCTETMLFHPFLVWILLNKREVTEDQAVDLVYFIEKGKLRTDLKTVAGTEIVSGDQLENREDFYISSGGWKDCTVGFLPRGTKFRITEYDGSEFYETQEDITWY